MPAETAYRFSLAKDGVAAHYYQSIESVEAIWDKLAPADNIFLQSCYLKTLEYSAPVDMKLGYLLFYQGDQPIGLAVLQTASFQVTDNIRPDHLEKMNPLARSWQEIKRKLAGRMTFNMLVCGNLLLSGTHHFYFVPEWASRAESLSILSKAMNRAASLLTERGHRINVLMIKDVYDTEAQTLEDLNRCGFHDVNFQPNMIMSIRPEWRNFEDYLASLTSKYRVRAKRATKKLNGVVRRELGQSEVLERSEELYRLYKNISDKAGFNLLELSPNYLSSLKYRFGDDFRVTGYFEGSQLIGFSTTLKNHQELEAHFLGLDESANRKYQLYFNMLLDMLKQGIEEGMEKIIFARTALEIKSSVGAKAHPMKCLFKYRYSMLNPLTGIMVNALAPTEEWVPRHPFRD